MLTRHPEFLRYVLFTDAVASGATGALMIAASGFLSGALSLPAGLLLAAGLVLVPYVLYVLWAATRPVVSPPSVRLIILCNGLWVLGSAVLLLGQWVAPNVLGYAFVIFQAAAVGLLGLAQYLGLGRPVTA